MSPIRFINAGLVELVELLSRPFLMCSVRFINAGLAELVELISRALLISSVKFINAGLVEWLNYYLEHFLCLQLDLLMQD